MKNLKAEIEIEVNSSFYARFKAWEFLNITSDSFYATIATSVLEDMIDDKLKT